MHGLYFINPREPGPITSSLDAFILQIKRVVSHARIFHNNLIFAEKMAGTIFKPPRTLQSWLIGHPLSTADTPYQTIGKARVLLRHDPPLVQDRKIETSRREDRTWINNALCKRLADADGDAEFASSPFT